MQVNIESLHFTANENLQNYVQEKVNKLFHFHDTIITIEVILRLDKAENTENKVCEIKISIPGQDLFVKRQSKSFEEATLKAVEAMENQIKKQKSKLENKKRVKTANARDV